MGEIFGLFGRSVSGQMAERDKAAKIVRMLQFASADGKLIENLLEK